MTTGIPGVRGRVLEGVPLAQFTTYQIGGPARYLVMPETPEDVARAVRFASQQALPWLAMGLGSNLLPADAGFPGVVIRLGKELAGVRTEQATWTVGAGLPTPLLAKRTAAVGLAGAHKLVGVPGTVGGGVAMNAGCHGVEYRDLVVDVTTVDKEGADQVVAADAIPFEYRASGLTDCVIVEATLAFGEGDPAVLKREMQALFSWRKAGTPFDQACCGSVFRNPGGERTAGQLIEHAGLKGFTIGQIQVSPKHANYFVNLGGGTADDVRRLIEHARATVQRELGVELRTEIEIISAG